MPEDVTADRIVRLDVSKMNSKIASVLYLAESNILEELGLSQQAQVEEEENNNEDENSIENSFYQRKGKPSRSKV